MKRDMDLVRELLLVVEANDGTLVPEPPEIAGYDPPEINHRITLLAAAGYLRFGMVDLASRLCPPR